VQNGRTEIELHPQDFAQIPSLAQTPCSRDAVVNPWSAATSGLTWRMASAVIRARRTYLPRNCRML
jgi:hypothetical protein